MGKLAILEETSTPDTPSEGNVLFSTVATPSLLRLKDDAGNVYTVALLGKDQTFTGAISFNKLIFPLVSDLTIAAGVITVTGSHHRVDTEGAGATDDLDTINGGTVGQFLVIRTVSASRDVVIKNVTGNILNSSGADVTLSSNNQAAMYFYNGSFWTGGLM